MQELLANPAVEKLVLQELKAAGKAAKLKVGTVGCLGAC